MELLAERGIDVSNRTVLRWVQAFGPQLAAEARNHRRPLGRSWYTDEMFFFRGKDKWWSSSIRHRRQPSRGLAFSSSLLTPTRPRPWAISSSALVSASRAVTVPSR
jgi:hypothetical protein